MEHDWLVAAGKDAGAIAMRVNAGTSAEVNAAGDLLLLSGAMRIVWRVPRAYQDIDGTRRPVRSHYAVRGSTIHLKLGAIGTICRW